MKLVEFPLAELEGWLPNIWHFLEDACEHSSGKYKPIDIVRLVYAKRMQLWSVIEEKTIHAIVVTEVIPYPHATVARILCTTGDNMELWAHLVETVEEWARALGCTDIEPIVRPGWKKFLKNRGYREQHIIMEKKL